MKILLSLIINSMVIFAVSIILSGVRVDSLSTALVVAVILGAVNILIRPIFLILTVPLTILTLGLFTFVINGLLVLLTDYLVPGFEVENLLWAILFSLLISMASTILQKLK